jgi:pimeloyl-ACP methyl ester carboxylesterase
MNISNSLFMVESGNPQGKPLILLHGGAGGVWTLQETASHLDEFHVFIPELPEHGSSAGSPPFSIQGASRQILAAVKACCGDTPLHVFGLSVGGQIALEMLSLDSSAFSSAIISSALIVPVPGYRLGIYSPLAMSLVYWLAVFPWKRCDPWIHWTMQTSSGIAAEHFEPYRATFRSLTPGGWTRAMSGYYAYRLPAGLEQARLPVLLIAGDRERSDAQPTNRILRRVLPQSCQVIYHPGDGVSAAAEHNWPVNSPELCARLIRAWVDGQPLPQEFAAIPD